MVTPRAHTQVFPPHPWSDECEIALQTLASEATDVTSASVARVEQRGGSSKMTPLDSSLPPSAARRAARRATRRLKFIEVLWPTLVQAAPSLRGSQH